MAIATVGEFVVNAIISPMCDFFALLHGLLDPAVRHVSPEYVKLLESQLAVMAWGAKLISAILAGTEGNVTSLHAFNDTLHTLAVSSPHLFGDLSGTDGMAYIAKHTYFQLANNSTLAEKVAAEFMGAVNSSIMFIARTLEVM